MIRHGETAGAELPGMPARPVYDPFAPITMGTGSRSAAGARTRQRFRRSEIRAAIRRILAAEGCERVTVREVAGVSGFAVQTIYNLVGPRNDAISDAISEYSIYVGRTALPRADDPMAVPAIVDRWIDAVAADAGFARQSNLIFFTDSRDIYYRFRDQQQIGMRNLMQRQKKCGVLRSDVDANALAESLVMYMSSMWIEWADRSLSIETLRGRLRAGVQTLLSGTIHSRYEELLSHWSDRGASRARPANPAADVGVIARPPFGHG